MAYKSIHTTYGLARMASAEATGTPINLTHMAVGDGNGNPTTPADSQTTLVREMYRSTVNRVYQDPDNALLHWAELIVPASEGGFTMREIGVFDADGGLFVVGNLPDTYKPEDTEGSFSDAVVRVGFMVSNAGVVTLIVDPAVAVASQQWVINNITAATLIPGGTTGQILAKDSNADGDYIWKDPTDANVVVDMIEETQTLAALQTTVILTVCTTNGLAVYIEGVRLRGDQWTAVDDTELTLASSYPAGTKFVAVQNEPAGTIVYPLARDLNLSDVPDKAVARTNLDVFSKAEVRNMVPPGIVDHYAGVTPPTGWLVRDGSAISRTVYAALFAVIGTTFGAGDGFNTFNLPDDRELFDRSWGGSSSGRALGSYQADQIKAHTHTVLRGTSEGDDVNTSTNGGGAVSPAIPTTSTGGSETCPKNRAYQPIIKY